MSMGDPLKSTDDGGFAYPQPIDANGNPVGDAVLGAGGMTLRDWFAGQALIGLISRPWNPPADFLYSAWCYEQADKMIERRKR